MDISYETLYSHRLVIRMKTIVISSLLLLFLFSFVIPIQLSYQSHSIEFPTGQTGISYENSPTIIRVTDANAAGSGSVSIQITSTTDLVGVTLDLPETSAGVFESSNFVIMDGPNFASIGDSIQLNFEDSNSNFNPGLTESVIVLVVSFSGDVEFIELIEDGTDSPNFTANLDISSEGVSPFDGVLQSSEGDTFRIFWPCDGASNGQIIPKPDNSKAAIEAAIGETVIFSYTDASLSTVTTDLTVIFSSGCGGSGGGLVISKIVLDFLAGGMSGGDFIAPQLIIPKINLSNLPLVSDILDFITNADPFTPITPLNDQSIDYPLSINGNGYLLTQFANTIETYTGKTGEPVSFKMTLFDATGIEHIALYTNLRGDTREIQDSDTFVIYNEEEPLEITDLNGFFSNVSFIESEYNGKYIANFNMTFTKPMDTSDVIIRTWDELGNSGDIKVFDAIRIEGELIVNPDTNNLIVPDSAEIVIPYYKMPHYEIPEADYDGNLVYYNSFGGMEERRVHPYHTPMVYPDEIGKNDRYDDEFYEKIINEESRAQTLVQSIISNPYTLSEEKMKNEKFFYPSKVGKLDRENRSTLNDVMMQERLKAEKICERLYSTNHLVD